MSCENLPRHKGCPTQAARQKRWREFQKFYVRRLEERAVFVDDVKRAAQLRYKIQRVRSML